ncbi:hypothetical protein LEP1GSC052_1461 [Leptospira kmetyi serovar Malaysia str. Bejo-Iso9]|nr:hypothetical protein LEP1GSC052_1461 [Leptospira kmetyi serovar Malaysia str. Bejo-Iso9]
MTDFVGYFVFGIGRISLEFISYVLIYISIVSDFQLSLNRFRTSSPQKHPSF